MDLPELLSGLSWPDILCLCTLLFTIVWSWRQHSCFCCYWNNNHRVKQWSWCNLLHLDVPWRQKLGIWMDILRWQCAFNEPLMPQWFSCEGFAFILHGDNVNRMPIFFLQWKVKYPSSQLKQPLFWFPWVRVLVLTWRVFIADNISWRECRQVNKGNFHKAEAFFACCIVRSKWRLGMKGSIPTGWWQIASQASLRMMIPDPIFPCISIKGWLFCGFENLHHDYDWVSRMMRRRPMGDSWPSACCKGSTYPFDGGFLAAKVQLESWASHSIVPIDQEQDFNMKPEPCWRLVD